MTSGTPAQVGALSFAQELIAERDRLTAELQQCREALRESCGLIDMLTGKLSEAGVDCGEMDTILIGRVHDLVGAALKERT